MSSAKMSEVIFLPRWTCCYYWFPFWDSVCHYVRMILDYWRLLRNFEDCRGLLKIIKDYQRLSRIIEYYQRLSENIEDYLRISKIIREYRGLSEIIEYHQRLSRITEDYRWLSWTNKDWIITIWWREYQTSNGHRQMWMVHGNLCHNL